MENSPNYELFEKIPISKAAAKLMLPTIAGSLVMVIYSLADTFFVGLVNDPIQNAAVSLAAPVLLAFNAVNNLFGIGSSSLMSRALGRGDYNMVKHGSAFGFYCSLGAGILFSLLCLIFFQPLLHVLGADTQTISTTANYIKWTVLIGAAPSILNVVFGYLVRAEGESLHSSLGTMSGCILNIILDPIFILPWGFNLGAEGAGLATFISNCFACLYFFILLWLKKHKTLVSIRPKDFTIRKNIIKEIFGIGLPASIQNLLNVFGMTILNNYVASYGADAVAAIGIAQKIYMVPVQVSLGGTQGIMPLIGYSYSSNNHKRFKESIAFVAKIMIPSMSLIAILCWLCSGRLIALFMNNASVIAYGRLFLRGYCFAMPFLVADFLVVGILQAVGKGTPTLVFAICRKLVFEIPAVIVLNHLFSYSGISYSACFSEILMTIIGILFLRNIFKNFK